VRPGTPVAARPDDEALAAITERPGDVSDLDCAIAQAAGIVGDWWSLLIVRDVAGGTTRFEALQRSLGVSRKVLSERLNRLVDDGVLRRVPYQDRPTRHEYLVTAAGIGLLPVLVSLAGLGHRYVMGDGSLTATSAATSLEARRVHGLEGTLVPPVLLTSADGVDVDPLGDERWTILYCFLGAFAPGARGYPTGWSEIPGAGGCTLESMTYRDRAATFTAAGAVVRGVSTRRPDQLEDFAAYAELPFALVSDQDSRLSAALRLPTFRASGQLRLKRLTMLVDPQRRIVGGAVPRARPSRLGRRGARAADRPEEGGPARRLTPRCGATEGAHGARAQPRRSQSGRSHILHQPAPAAL
jgi:DNA-binding HxlR family transcriptional regulator/peroxiredoxin